MAEFERLAKHAERPTPHMSDVCCTHFNSPECWAVSGDCADGCVWNEKVWERLAAYEDSGLSPEQVEEMAKAQKWISVKDRLPDSEDEVLVCTRSKNGSRSVDKGYYMHERWVRRGCAEVTHWMPLPEPPATA